MSLESNTQVKPARGKKAGTKPRIEDWTIEQATMPGHMNLCLVAVHESIDGASRSTNRCFLLQCERAAELIDALKEALEDATALQRLQEQATRAPVAPAVPASSVSMLTGADDSEILLNHFDLGAYGLVGN